MSTTWTVRPTSTRARFARDLTAAMTGITARSHVTNLRPSKPAPTTFVVILTDLEVSLAEAACQHSESQAVRDVGVLLREQVDEARARQRDECNPHGIERPRHLQAVRG